MHTRVLFLVIFCTSIQDFKTNEQLSKKKFSFLFLLKSWENADTAFCIVADDKLFLTKIKNWKTIVQGVELNIVNMCFHSVSIVSLF